MALGRKLVNGLRLSPYDKLGRWMAYYIAELMTGLKKAKIKDKTLIQKKCFDAILALWEHRNFMPDGKRPFEDLEPIVHVIKSLDPDNNAIRYSRSIRSSIISGEEGEETKELLETVEDIDYSAKMMIAELLFHASRRAINKSKEWVNLAEAAKVKINDAPGGLLFHYTALDTQREETLDYLVGKLKRFESSIKIASAFASGMRKRISELSHENENDCASKKSGDKKSTIAKKTTVTGKKATPIVGKTTAKEKLSVTKRKVTNKSKAVAKSKHATNKRAAVKKSNKVKKKTG